MLKEKEGVAVASLHPLTEMFLFVVQTGRIDMNFPKICGHKAAVLDVQFNPFNENMIASCAEDALVMVWVIPEGGKSQTAFK